MSPTGSHVSPAGSQMRNVVVTGGLGFLGQHLVAAILDRYPEAEVSIAARSHREIFLPQLRDSKRLSIRYHCDLLEPETLAECFRGAQAVFHAAAMVSFWRRDRRELIRQNRDGTRNVLELCRSHGVEKLVYVSSTAAVGYNDSPDIPADESLEFNVKRDGSYAYSFSKYLAEQEVRRAAAEGLPAVVVNPSSIYGPGDEKIRPLLESIKRRKLPAMMPGGLACIDVRDAASGIIAACEHGAAGQRYILTGGNYSQVEFISTIARVLGAPVPKKTFSAKTGALLKPFISLFETLAVKPPKITSEIFDMGFRFRYFSTKKAEEELDWKPSYTLEETFRDIVAKEEMER